MSPTSTFCGRSGAAQKVTTKLRAPHRHRPPERGLQHELVMLAKVTLEPERMVDEVRLRAASYSARRTANGVVTVSSNKSEVDPRGD